MAEVQLGFPSPWICFCLPSFHHRYELHRSSFSWAVWCTFCSSTLESRENDELLGRGFLAVLCVWKRHSSGLIQATISPNHSSDQRLHGGRRVIVIFYVSFRPKERRNSWVSSQKLKYPTSPLWVRCVARGCCRCTVWESGVRRLLWTSCGELWGHILPSPFPLSLLIKPQFPVIYKCGELWLILGPVILNKMEQLWLGSGLFELNHQSKSKLQLPKFDKNWKTESGH